MECGYGGEEAETNVNHIYYSVKTRAVLMRLWSGLRAESGNAGWIQEMAWHQNMFHPILIILFSLPH